MSYEVELKFPVLDPEAIRRALAGLGAKAVSNCNELDTYLQHPSRSFARTDEALRVREVMSRVVLTYKGPKIDAVTKTREEIEIDLATAPSAAAKVLRLLERLGFGRVREVRKDRELFEVPWQGYVVQASLDQVAGLGSFLELELSSDPAQLEKSRQSLLELAERLNLQNSERRSYLELLLAKEPPAASSRTVAEDWSES